MNRIQGLMTIEENKWIAKDIYQMILSGQLASLIKFPGQFINIKLTHDSDPFLRRPISVADYDEHSITIIYKVVGHGTRLLSEKKEKEQLDVLVGLGNGFTDFNYQEVLLIGGGVGVPPLYALAKKLVQRGVKVTTILGFQSSEDAFYIEQFESLGKVYVATDDGGLGQKGRVNDVIANHQIAFDTYYACGPTPMLKALTQFIKKDGYLSFESRMACGIGACMACVCKVKEDTYKRICLEGPVLKASEVQFDE